MVMRDAFIEEIYNRMGQDDSIFFLTADFGSPKLDAIRQHYADRFINVGIAEQNLINVSTGLALEGFTVYAYAIAPFLTMRAYEQIRVNLALHAQLKELNVNMIGVGAGLSYEVSGPTHQCIEDISIMRALPNIDFFSPCDSVTARKFVEYSIRTKKPKYIRFDSKPLENLYNDEDDIDFYKGFKELIKGDGLCLVSTGYMTQKAAQIATRLAQEGINVGVIDVFMLKPVDEELLFDTLNNYRSLLTLEEGIIKRGGLDSIIASLLEDKGSDISLTRMGLKDSYVFEIGGREYLHGLNGLGVEQIIDCIKTISMKV